ncbi:PREDICTED: armadillo repeat-containing protein 7-like isoform X2 [Amphimedon queenslandica]|uniref:Armadillo repeat-containing domain-containing protein n=1 Tax=Amphimedon queenslandica TaxID=400682 RepID=A0A1X7USE2_AMPQE|nr:PREDICTED: armadillo repeat-containing protein 7-like isoform X2 [Amphimedon queenslandica]|eukprot:XP_019852626.1 PREDICTED: armadillo repeat-containing protein 7-like isoform X2 [Amphimedon queenslandica]
MAKKMKNSDQRGRFEYLQALVNEFQTTKAKDYKLQVLANLANFAYDPVNYDYFRELNILDLFLDVVAESTDEKMIEFAMGGICNCCLDETNQNFFLESDCLDIAIKCLKCTNEETVLSAITTLLYLITPVSRKVIVNRQVCDLMKQFQKSSNKRLSNLATIFLQDYAYMP